MRGRERNREVVTTELEEGAVLLNIETGFYYSLNEPGAEIWRGVDAAADPDALAERLRERFALGDVSARTAVTEFLAELEREGLVAPGEGDEEPVPSPSAVRDPAGERQSFAKPELVKHDEPLHEVSMSPFDSQLPLAE
jgi:hypothetical protein